MQLTSYTIAEQEHAMNDPVMVDLETWGTAADSALVSIGAVKFDPDTKSITGAFYKVIDKESCLEIGMSIDPDCIKHFWDKQPPAVREVLDLPGEHIIDVLDAFSKWMGPNACMWGNGADFDNSMIAHAFKLCFMKPHWKFWNNRCYRTMKNMFPQVKMTRVGTHHNAYYDAESQAKHLMDILSVMRAGQRALG
jgi:hypothetical protein